MSLKIQGKLEPGRASRWEVGWDEDDGQIGSYFVIQDKLIGGELGVTYQSSYH